ncbi:MAG: hypothetical protein JW874_08605 [Spirochaetales bacterium]|nr:hypothetical protein [Spirochaetales bacterium]
MIRNKRFLFIFLIVFISFPLFAQNVIEKTVQAAESNLLIQNYEKAYSYAKFLIKNFRGSEMDFKVLTTVERVIEAYSRDLFNNKKWQTLAGLEPELVDAPDSVKMLASKYIDEAKKKNAEEEEALAKELEQKQAEEQRLAEEEVRLKQIEEAIKKEQARQAQIDAIREAEKAEFERREKALLEERSRLTETQRSQIDRIIEENRALQEVQEEARQREQAMYNQRQQELEKERSLQEERYRMQLQLVLDRTVESSDKAFDTTAKLSNSLIIGLSVLGGIILIVLALFVIMTLRNQRTQQDQFENTVRILSTMKLAEQSGATALPFIPQADQTRALPQAAQAALPDNTGGGSQAGSVTSIQALLAKCREIAGEIDEITTRKNASSSVAELVYKISKSLGYSETDCVLYYAVGLVYDIGFLNIDPAIFRADHINEKQFEQIKTHTSIGINMVFFVPQEFRDIFKDGVSKHHENLDGSGYPYGLKDGDIPYIARVIRVAESFIALISNREYREIKDRKSAIEELRNDPDTYDTEIINVLDSIV